MQAQASSLSSSVFKKWFDLLNRYRFLFLTVPLILCFLFAWGVMSLRENSDGRIFFAPESDERQALLSLEQNFTESNSLLLVVNTDGADLFEPRALEILLQLTEQAWQIPYVTRVNSLTNFQRVSSEEDEIVITSLITPEMLASPAQIDEARVYALSDQDLLGQIISEDGKTAAIALNIAAPRGDSAVLAEIMAAVENLKNAAAQDDDQLKFYITGDAPLDAAFSESYAHDLEVVFPFFIVMVFAVSFYFFRSLRVAGLILLLMALVVSATMGIAGYSGIELTAGTSGVPIILMTISLADFIHILSSLRRKITLGHAGKDAVHEALRHNFLPITLTSFTTFIGFISLNFNDAPPFQDMGNLVAIGIVLSFFLTFTFFPAVLLGMKLDRVFPKNMKTVSQNSRYAEYFARFICQWRSAVMVVTVLVAIFVCRGIWLVELDDDWVKYFDETNNFRQDTEFVAGHLTGVDTIDYHVVSDYNGGVVNADFLAKLDVFEKWALQQPEIVHVTSIVSIFKKMNRHMNGASPGKSEIAENHDLNAQYLLLYEMSLPMGLDLNDRIDISKESTRVTITGTDMTSQQMRRLDHKVSQKLQTMNLVDDGVTGTGVPLLFANLSERNIHSMLTGIGFAIGLVSLIIMIVFRSVKLGIISFVVNILPILMGFGVWGWAYQYVGLSLTVVAAIAFGIVVDDSIHFITKFQKSLNEPGQDSENALVSTFSEVGGALMMTTFILVLGFGVLCFSTFQPTWALGLISAVMITIALIYDVLLLPAILVMFPSKKVPRL
ncbi:efflux RND transporter permease subunit [Paremcibacter congregatus]|uniref:efflux RND transporter permease subunit n=1 Tax=Paremcibacter congregatus TaxID=2043170 RepID=UPI003A91B4F1